MGFECARCGGDVGSAGVTEAVTVTALADDMTVRSLYLCLRKDKTHQRCASRVLTAKATANATGDEPLGLYQPT